MASVQEHIIGNCLCVLGDAMAMPIGSMIAKFRDEFEAHIERARMRRGLDGAAGSDAALAAQGALEEGSTLLGHSGEGDQAPGAHQGEPGTQKGGA
jgi:NADH-ubiquinone oxidoreductase-F iron-sulfur binding region